MPMATAIRTSTSRYWLPVPQAESLKTGRYLKTEPAPLTNLFLSMADKMGLEGIESHGDSTGRLAGV